MFDMNNDFFVVKIKDCAEVLSQEELDQLQGLIKKVELLKPSNSEYIVISRADTPKLFENIKALTEPFYGKKPPQEKKLEMWTIYDNPADYPGKFVARKFVLDVPTKTVIVEDTLNDVRRKLPDKTNLVCIERFFEDDPCIVEVWL